MADEPSISPQLLENLRSGRFSPEVAARLERALRTEGAPAGGDAALAGPPATPEPEAVDVLQTIGDAFTVMVLMVLVLGAVGLALALTGLIDGPMLLLAAAVFVIVLLAVVVVGTLNSDPPVKPVKAAKPPKAEKPKPAARLGRKPKEITSPAK